MDKSIWPLSNKEDSTSGWTLSVDFLKAIQKAARTHGVDEDLETVEGVLLAAEAHAILGMMNKP